jgi:hypothetical protein
VDPLSHVFISYSRRQQVYARRLAAHLGTRHGIPVWIDDELITGDRWENVIKARIDECAAMIVVMSRDAEASEWVGREIARAQTKGKPVLPVLFDGEVFFRLSDVQFEDVQGGVLPGERFIAALRQATGTATDALRVTTSSAAEPTQGGATGRRTATRTVASLIGVAVLLLAVGFGVTAAVLRGNLSTVGVGTDEVVNTAGGYRIEVPEGWSSTQEDRVTKVNSPDGMAVITFGLGRTGPMPVAATLFFQQVGSEYTEVQVFPPEARQIGGLPALIYGGAGINAKDTRIRFLAITVENSPTNYGITVFTLADSDPQAVLPQANQIVDSFRELPSS